MAETVEERLKHYKYSERSRNENEKRVARKILELFREYPDTCFCHQCVDNIFCLALNALPPKYENATVHYLLKKNACTKKEIENAVKNAIRFVSEHPKKKYTEHAPGK